MVKAQPESSLIVLTASDDTLYPNHQCATSSVVFISNYAKHSRFISGWIRIFFINVVSDNVVALWPLLPVKSNIMYYSPSEFDRYGK